MFSSDSLFAALTIAMRDLGMLEPWLAATADAPVPLVRLSSCYPYTGQTLLVQPPRSVWPPVGAGKVRWKTARFVPVSVLPFLLRGDDLNEEQWAVDPVSESLLPLYRSGPAPPPFRIARRKLAPVDRVEGASDHAESVACLEFSRGSGMWFLASFEDQVWADRLRAAVRLLADSGVGGGRSRGWGRSLKPDFRAVDLPGFLLGDVTVNGGGSGWWLLSLFTPADSDSVDWSRGNYGTAIRSGRFEETGDVKSASRMVSEGSVLLSAATPNGAARNVAPAEASHPVLRSGIAFAVEIPWQEGQRFSLGTEKEAAVPAPAASVAVGEPTPEEAAPTEPAEPETAEADAPEQAPAESTVIETAEQPMPEEPAGTLPESESDMDETPKPTPVDVPPVGEPPTPMPPPAEEPPVPAEPPMDEPPSTDVPEIREPGQDPDPEPMT